MKSFLLRNLLVAAMAVAATTALQAAIPAGYYNSLNGKSGQALKDAIHELTAKHTVLSYSALWNYFPTTDCYPDNTERVWDMYSDNNYYFNGTRSVSGMNKEHSFPKSWWGGSTTVNSYTDLHHLYPSDATANSRKSAWPLGVVSSTSWTNGVSKIGSPSTGQGGGASTVFEPDDRYKGDFARTYFYMACCYQDLTWNKNYMVTNSDWKTLTQWSINLLVQWARADAVSDKEKDRNDAVYKFQYNRNPFIDFPSLFEYIWGSKQGEAFNIDAAGDPDDPVTPSTGDPTLITPVQDTEINFGEIALGQSVTKTVYIKGENIKSNINLQLYRWQYTEFSIPVTSVDPTTVNSEEGYPLDITYTPTAVGADSAKLLILDGGLVGSIGIILKGECLEAPTLKTIVALPATIGDDGTSYTAYWEPTTDEIDYYIINRIIYAADGSVVRTESVTTDDADVTSYEFNDLADGQTHTYTVQAYRLGYTSEESNVIYVRSTSLSEAQVDRPFYLLHCDGGVIVKSSGTLGAARIFTLTGALVKEIDALNNDDYIELPSGIYILTTSTSRKAHKIVIP